MKKFILIIILLFSVSFSNAQIINIKIDNLTDRNAVLVSLSGEKISFVDSISANSSGEFETNFLKNHPGIYRLIIDNKTWLNFIYDNEDVIIETDAAVIPDSLNIIESKPNMIYYQFLRINKDYKVKSELLQVMLNRYPEKDDYYKTTLKQLIQLQEDYLYFINVTSQKDPNSFIARYVRSSQLPPTAADKPFDEQLEYLKTYALDMVNFFDSDLIYSDAFTNKTIEYLTYFRNPQLPLELLEKEFMSAVDSILSKAKVNTTVYQHIVEYLLEGFKKFGFDNVINYIVDNYVIKDDLCLNEKLSSSLDRRISQAAIFKPGYEVPNISLPDESGLLVELNKINADKTLIIFYASWCPHCKTLLPQIYKLYASQKEKLIEVIAVSIDTSQTDWLNYIKTNNLNWINLNDQRGWNGQAAVDYYIYATPAMFLVDSEKKLISMPAVIEEIKF